MANTIFPTDTATATPVAADLVMIADVSDSNKPKDNTIENIVLAVVDDASTLTTRIWSADKTNTTLATKQASDATLTTLSGKTITGTGDIVLATSPTLTAPVISTITNTGTITLPTSTDTLVGRATTDTLTNKRVTPRVGTTVSGSAGTVGPTSDPSDVYTVTAASAALTINDPSGTPTNGQRFTIRIKDNGTARAITWGASYRAVGVTLPTTTVISKTVYVFMIWNSADSKRDCFSVAQEA